MIIHFRLLLICADQLHWDGAERAAFEPKTPSRDGTTHLEMTPIDFMERLAALVPRRCRCRA